MDSLGGEVALDDDGFVDRCNEAPFREPRRSLAAVGDAFAVSRRSEGEARLCE